MAVPPQIDPQLGREVASRARVGLQDHLTQLEQLTSFSQAGSHLVLAGSTGTILCLPIQGIDQKSTEGSFLLQDSRSILGGLFGR